MDSSQESFKNTTSNHATTCHHHHREPPTETSPRSLCPKGCGFFGTAANNDLCSTCYKNSLKKCMEEIKSPACGSTSVSLDLTPPTNPFPCFHATRKRKTTTDDDHDHDGVMVNSPPLIHVKKRCRRCSKKVGLIGYKCKCGEIFCGVHRHPEEHGCGVDFKIAGKFVLMEENPVCKGDKLKNRV
ncbi:hypothetical protein BUALT_Bualt06G0123600 [Buddleja alternifolia]|uniref:Uncharacterized protein n=1 Tax=Buddleja alternifolia TaxID=168488 RepID=A0AAV6XMJ7_9LAMI|nr:hypothetical protein BUALT_Bualt06G0123600 [Buddleja alternifolia]